MAKPTDTYPETATHGATKRETNGEGDAALQESLSAHGETLAEALETTDELQDALTTAILIAASADEEELDHITSSAANLVEAADGLSTDGAAALATDLGNNAEELSPALDSVLDLQREGHLDDLVAIATAFTKSLSPEEVEELSTMLEKNGGELVGALDTVLELQREDHLDGLVSLATTFSTLDVGEDTAQGVNTFLASVGDAQREAEPVGLFGMLRALGGRDARAGLGYLLALLKSQGRRISDR
ncbi:DUF1641 domain-containing protein (plasmid) [Haloplanus ruber]|uniref:DUF1641 domain-containing protein n=1 Tax=Haloplanus ruber TaxID=869892 RepID=A0ABD6CWP9_9EURY|nr:DUF1641 domain-containing protein [Haloplanus ruber]